jgi:outer membrane protein assembly factor BamB
MKRLLFVALNIILIAYSLPLKAEISPWPMFRHDPRHTGRTPFTGPAKPVIAWQFNAGDTIGSSPVLGRDGTVYFGTGIAPQFMATKFFYALTPEGKVKWTFPVESGVFSSAAVGPDGKIFFSCFDANLYAIEDSLTYPHYLWQANLGNKAYSSPNIGPDGTIYVGSLSFFIWAFKNDGSARWVYISDWCVFSSPALSPDGMIYIGSKDEHLYAFQEDGDKAWAAATGTFFDGYLVDSSPAVGDDGTIYVGTDPRGASGFLPVPVDNVFFAFRPDGQVKWRYPIKDGIESSPAIGPDGTIYVGSYDGYIYALEDHGDKGVLKWRYQTGGWVDSSPALDGNGVVYVGSRDHYLYALNPDGTLRWKYLTDGEIESSPAIDADGRLYVGTFSGTLYCFGDKGPDAGVAAIVSPAQAAIGSDYIPTVSIASYRSGTYSTNVSCTVTSGNEVKYTETLRSVAVNGGETTLVKFSPWKVQGVTGKDLKVSFTTALPGDNNEYNDTLAASIQIIDSSTGVDSSAGNLPRELALNPCYPNPFNASTTISFSIPPRKESDKTGDAKVQIAIYDLNGRAVRTFLPGSRSAGVYTIRWDGRDDRGNVISSGVYIVSLSMGNINKTAKIVMLK